MDATQFAAVMTQVVTQQEKQIAQIQQHHAQQMALVQQQVADAVAAAAAPHANAPPRGPRVAAPTPFEGRAATLDEWTAAMERQFAWYNTTDEKDRVRIAVAHLQGPAWEWWHTLAGPLPASWGNLKLALRTRFQPIASAETARAQLFALSQGKHSVNDYVDSFRRLLARIPDMGPADQLFQFIRGLRPALATQLRVHDKKTLDEAINLAVRVGSLGEMAAAQASSGSSAPMELDALAGIEGLEADTSTATDTPITRAELQQLLNAMREGHRGTGASSSNSNRNGNGRYVPRGLPTHPNLTPDQVKEYMEAGKCFGCGSKDHRGRQCHKRIVGADGRVSWSK
jgi:Retrotransposon gag protein